MAKATKRYVITCEKGYYNALKYVYGPMTIEESWEFFGYTLECGVLYQHEKGNKKINRYPKTIKSLLTNLENAANNSARNGYAGVCYTAEEYKGDY